MKGYYANKMEENSGDKALRMLEGIAEKLERKLEKIESGKKNSHLHIMIETKVANKLKEEARSKRISLAEFCRQKLSKNSQLDRIEGKIDLIQSKSLNKKEFH